ncbi:Oidioi.mRNA.OKI2018_I69.XSR.g13998.t1.cds [Oikopleura dioica]|uniref:Oidioi.mRNA.OKI2018_I69.XSR.g13998.t1.cds n=1 Tax=Oikopleura dioica TaxID=34765 RepID=A0ABN7SFS6_OIKDI|nr:Oidioi.mRNA.OKI2018_I69.XSR.g13998.t1.cds [Oikopleura dioica]
MQCSSCLLLSSLCVSHYLAFAYAQVPDVDIEVPALIDPQPRCPMLFNDQSSPGKRGKIRVNVLDEIRELNVSSWETGEVYEDVLVKKFDSSELPMSPNETTEFFMNEILKAGEEDSLVLVYLRTGS